MLIHLYYLGNNETNYLDNGNGPLHMEIQKTTTLKVAIIKEQGLPRLLTIERKPEKQKASLAYL